MKSVGVKLICSCHGEERWIVKKHPRLGLLCQQGVDNLKNTIKKEPNWEKKCWDAFSKFIRLRDADKDGNCKCFTCPFTNHWNRFDCGHGIPRQFKSTWLNEQNNHAQCKRCNGFQGGMREVYKVEMDKRYGTGVWDKMEVKSKLPSRKTDFDYKVLTLYYTQEFEKMKLKKAFQPA